MEPIENVRSFWESHVNNEYYTARERESPEYFREIERRRYRHHYHLPETFDRIASFGTGGKTLLEIGCGMGIDTLHLARRGFDGVVGVDLTNVAVDIAARRAEREGLGNVRFQMENAESLSFGDEEFDYVYSFGVLHHTPHIDKAIGEVHRVLRPGGRAFVMLYHRTSIVNAVHQLFRLPYESPRSLKDHCPVVRRFSRREAIDLFRRFSSVAVRTDYPFTYGMRWGVWILPVPIKRYIGRQLGWHLMIEAEK